MLQIQFSYKFLGVFRGSHVANIIAKGLKGKMPKNKFVLLVEFWIFTSFFGLFFPTWFYMM